MLMTRGMQPFGNAEAAHSDSHAFNVEDLLLELLQRLVSIPCRVLLVVVACKAELPPCYVELPA